MTQNPKEENNRDAYYQALEPIIQELSDLFDPLCTELCPSCTISCCEPCVREKGYYEDERFEEMRVQYGFNPQKGFLGPNGCILPRLLRSKRCLYHICLRIQFSIIKKSGAEGFAKFKEKINQLAEQHQLIENTYR